MPRVLLAEDDDGIRNAYGFALSHEGFDVTFARSGGEALDAVQDKQFDVLLLDMVMLGGSGLDFLRSYDVRKKSPHTKVVALSNIDSPAVEERAQALGVTDYLNKSKYEPTQLVEYLRALLAPRS